MAPCAAKNAILDSQDDPEEAVQFLFPEIKSKTILCLPDEMTVKILGPMETFKEKWLIAQVCRDWRRVTSLFSVWKDRVLFVGRKVSAEFMLEVLDAFSAGILSAWFCNGLADGVVDVLMRNDVTLEKLHLDFLEPGLSPNQELSMAKVLDYSYQNPYLKTLVVEGYRVTAGGSGVVCESIGPEDSKPRCNLKEIAFFTKVDPHAFEMIAEHCEDLELLAFVDKFTNNVDFTCLLAAWRRLRKLRAVYIGTVIEGALDSTLACFLADLELEALQLPIHAGFVSTAAEIKKKSGLKYMALGPKISPLENRGDGNTLPPIFSMDGTCPRYWALQKIVLSGFSLSAEDLAAIGFNCPNLKWFGVEGGTIQDEGMNCLLESAKGLQAIVLRYVRMMNGKHWLDCLTVNLSPSLQLVYIKGCWQIDRRLLRSAAAERPDVRFVVNALVYGAASKGNLLDTCELNWIRNSGRPNLAALDSGQIVPECVLSDWASKRRFRHPYDHAYLSRIEVEPEVPFLITACAL